MSFFVFTAFAASLSSGVAVFLRGVSCWVFSGAAGAVTFACLSSGLSSEIFGATTSFCFVFTLPLTSRSTFPTFLGPFKVAFASITFCAAAAAAFSAARASAAIFAAASASALRFSCSSRSRSRSLKSSSFSLRFSSPTSLDSTFFSLSFANPSDKSLYSVSEIFVVGRASISMLLDFKKSTARSREMLNSLSTLLSRIDFTSAIKMLVCSF